ncbi:hypothetical protein ACFU53_15935 [Streptomyces sp. NPDC057474]|uniref:hypothetical protein n=1 Tax=Streptomyces sp. NPDC057474 TaxID=3346144 RepID=UPI0036B62E99
MSRPPGRRAVRVLGLIAVAVTVACLVVVGCTPEQGPAGTVVDRDKRALTVRQTDGTEMRFTVSKKTARSCPEGAAYPQCADNPSWTRR